jgi:ribonucleoside-diphosphate reductase alpha chain
MTAKSTRERLPDTRKSVTHKAVICASTPGGKPWRLHVYITVGLFPDGRPAELFLCINDASETLVGFATVWAIAISLCLQSGVELSKLIEKFAFQQFAPMGFTENPDIRSCKSLCDYVIRWMEKEFMSEPSSQISDAVIATEELARDVHLSKPISEET